MMLQGPLPQARTGPPAPKARSCPLRRWSLSHLPQLHDCTSTQHIRQRGSLLVACAQIADPDYSIDISNLRLLLGREGNQRQVLRGVDLQVKRGSLHMLLGPNGCGKSTLLKVLGGLVWPFTGKVQADSPSGFVFQNPDHQVVMPTVAADVAFGLGRYTLPEEKVEQRVRDALALVSMQDFMHRATHTLSGGQKQRVAIAGALAEGPRLLLLDELTTFLDVEDQFGVLEAVRQITHEKRDVTAIWVTHRFEELDYADAATYMLDGKVAFSGSPAELKQYLQQLGAVV